LFVVTPGDKPLLIVANYPEVPLPKFIGALPEGVEPVAITTFPGIGGKVSVLVFGKQSAK
jgi:hypothetical protein